jgi:hypothetical protein
VQEQVAAGGRPLAAVGTAPEIVQDGFEDLPALLFERRLAAPDAG